MTSEYAFDIEELGKRYRVRQPRRAARSSPMGDHPVSDHFWALRDLTVQIRHGETVGVLGRNGAGKSTVLKLLAGVTDPSTGVARVTGRIGALLEVGAGFHPELSGRDNVALVGAILGMKRRETLAVFDDIVEFSGVADFIDVPVKRYSSGMYLRLAFSVAAHLRAENLLIDEALAVGDQAFREKCIDKLRDLATGGRTVLFVSHDASSVQRLCERALVFERGRLVADDDTAEALLAYIAVTSPPDRVERTELADPSQPHIAGVVRSDRGPTDELGQHLIGQRVDLEIDVEIPDRWPTAGLRVLVEVIGADQWPVTGSQHSLDGITPGRHRLKCAFPELRVSPGRFSFTVKVTDDGAVVDSISQLFAFAVDGAGRTGPTWTWRYVEDATWTSSERQGTGSA